MSAKLILCRRGATIVNRDALKDIPVPKKTRTFTPIPHDVFVRSMLKYLHKHDFEPVREEYAVNNDAGHSLFGVIDLESRATPDYNPSIGFRTSNNGHMAMRAVAGLRVLVCENLALNGDQIVMKRAHTGMLDIDEEMEAAIKRFAVNSRNLDGDVCNWKEMEIDKTVGKGVLLDLFAQRILPATILPTVAAEWDDPSFAEFTENGFTAWRLMNAVTTAARELPIGQRNRSLLQFGSFFRERFGDN